MPSRTALVAGASGLIGHHVLHRLLGAEAWDRVVSVGRRPVSVAHPKLEQRVADFDRLLHAPDFPSADDAFCCLGATIKKAGSEEAFRRVDLGLVLAFANAALERGASQFLVVSALGASARSRLFYNRTKGEMEDAVGAQEFEAVQIVRPALLLGDRDENRPGERASQLALGPLAPVMLGPLRKYRPIRGDAVAAALVAAAQVRPLGVHVYESDELQRLAS